MPDSKAERRKCGLRLLGWPGVLFNHCVLYGITLVKVLSTRIVSISSTLSLILEPNPSMSENMCGLAVRSELDGISHQCVTKSSGRLAPPGFLRCNLQSQVLLLTCQQCLISSMESHWDMKLKSAASTCRRCPAPVSHPSNDRSYLKQFEENNERRSLAQSGCGEASYDPGTVPPARLLFLHATLISSDQKCINNSSAQLKLFTCWYN